MIKARSTIASLRAFEDDLLKNVTQAIERAAALAAQVAQATTSFGDRTGRLRASIVRGRKSPLLQFVQAGNSSAYYAPFVEFGTSRMSARRFMKTARDRAEVAVIRFVQAGASRAIR